MTNEERIAALEAQVVSLTSQITAVAMALADLGDSVHALETSKADATMQAGGLIGDLISTEGYIAHLSSARIADLSAQAGPSSPGPETARQLTIRDLVTPEMRKAAEDAVMLRLCSELGPHRSWDWIVEDVIEAFSQTVVSGLRTSDGSSSISVGAEKISLSAERHNYPQEALDGIREHSEALQA